jgi:hypothetical protein
MRNVVYILLLSCLIGCAKSNTRPANVESKPETNGGMQNTLPKIMLPSEVRITKPGVKDDQSRFRPPSTSEQSQ